MNERKIHTPLTRRDARALRAGDRLLISGTLYTARDESHKRIIDLLESGKKPPFSLRDQIIYYVGPTPAPPGEIIGSAGPTTGYRMDSFTPRLICEGITATIGKGVRGPEVIAAMKEYGAVYLAALGGGGALLQSCIKAVEEIAFPDLGTEAVRRFTVVDFPVVVAIDSLGTNLYERNKA
ncbi:MAG: Fe-S-containing hydro-lyase [Candidatus Auribacterota bacterium]|jgi:fumarate hydratase subunit beta|uniref:Fe-S-containing hydro-lyase n=1 Tax=Candidatus Auribacter fodinae TaxID=2093366 RepID=A0A3A4R3K4_9BACT|nr:MAG: Fe-S-containing hydro-lyase [Candidatus Auribacter fodinae]